MAPASGPDTTPMAMTPQAALAALLSAAVVSAALPAPAHANPSVVAVARAQIGKPYRWGAAGPDAFDCSGLIVWVYAQIGVTLPHSSQALARGGQPVERDQLAPGDVIIFYPNASHAGIYSADGMVIHASMPGRPVAEVPLDAAGPYSGARRY